MLDWWVVPFIWKMIPGNAGKRMGKWRRKRQQDLQVYLWEDIKMLVTANGLRKQMLRMEIQCQINWGTLKWTLHRNKNLLEWGSINPEVIRSALQTGARGKTLLGEGMEAKKASYLIGSSVNPSRLLAGGSKWMLTMSGRLEVPFLRFFLWLIGMGNRWERYL